MKDLKRYNLDLSGDVTLDKPPPRDDVFHTVMQQITLLFCIVKAASYTKWRLVHRSLVQIVHVFQMWRRNVHWLTRV